MKTKSKDELSQMDVPELVEYMAALNAEVDHKDDEHKEALKAQEDEHKKEKEEQARKAEDEMKKKEAKLAAVLKAMDEEDKEKREAMIKSAMSDDEDKNKKDANDDSDKDDEEKKALKAELTYLTAAVKKPKIEFLASVYKASNIPDSELKEYIAGWEKLGPKELDAEIKKTQHLASVVGVTEKDNPIGFSASITPDFGSTSTSFNASKSFEKIDKMSPSEAFSQPGVN